LRPAATSRVFPSRGFSRSTVSPTRRRTVPPCRYRPFAHRYTGCHDRTTRLRGFAPWTDAFRRPDFWALPAAAPLLGFPPPSGSGSPIVQPGSPGHPLLAFSVEVFSHAEAWKLAPPSRLQRLFNGLADASVSGIIHLLEVPGLPERLAIPTRPTAAENLRS
jgi:hypothetical protein